jgi:hypothetical protein
LREGSLTDEQKNNNGVYARHAFDAEEYKEILFQSRLI